MSDLLVLGGGVLAVVGVGYMELLLYLWFARSLAAGQMCSLPRGIGAVLLAAFGGTIAVVGMFLSPQFAASHWSDVLVLGCGAFAVFLLMSYSNWQLHIALAQSGLRRRIRRNHA